MDFYLENKNISRATVKSFTCPNCDFKSPLFSIIGDSWAMNFLGVIGIFNSDGKELFITHLTKDEFQNYRNIEASTICNRLELLLNRKNLIFLRKSEDENGKLFLKCPKCESKMKEIKEQSLEEYVDEGGKVYTIGVYQTI
jgi:hypothetical protein